MRALLLVLLVAGEASAKWPPQLGTGGGGTSAMNFLRIETGARPLAMAGAACAASEDVTGLFWNPATLALVPNHQLSLTHAALYQTIKYDTLCYGQRAGRSSGFAIAFANLGMSRIPRTNEYPLGDPRAGEYAGEPATYAAGGILLQAGWSTQLAGVHGSRHPVFADGAIGVSLKFASMQLDTTTDTAFAVDLGYVYRQPETGWRMAFAVQNLGVDVKSRMIPLTVRVGAADFHWKDRIVLAYDLSFASDSIVKAHLGFEFAPVVYGQKVALRLGYKIETDASSTQGIWKPTFDRPTGVVAGIGLLMRYRRRFVQFDLGYAPFGALGEATARGTLRLGVLVNV